MNADKVKLETLSPLLHGVVIRKKGFGLSLALIQLLGWSGIRAKLSSMTKIEMLKYDRFHALRTLNEHFSRD
jgi:hypothetical protein